MTAADRNGNHGAMPYSRPPTGLPAMLMVASRPSLRLRAFGYERISTMDLSIASEAGPRNPLTADSNTAMASSTGKTSLPAMSSAATDPQQMTPAVAFTMISVLRS